MKYRQLAFALAMTPVVASAQSSVTVYGLADIGVTATRSTAGVTQLGGAVPTAARRTTQVDSGLGPGSRLGFRGTEDLGGGLRAIFTMEGGIGVDSGTFQQGGLPFGRQVFVGLRGETWSVTAGRQYSPMDPVLAMTDALGGAYWGNVLTNSGHIFYAGLAAAPGGGTFHTASRIDNSLLATYRSGAIGASFMVG